MPDEIVVTGKQIQSQPETKANVQREEDIAMQIEQANEQIMHIMDQLQKQRFIVKTPQEAELEKTGPDTSVQQRENVPVPTLANIETQ